MPMFSKIRITIELLCGPWQPEVEIHNGCSETVYIMDETEVYVHVIFSSFRLTRYSNLHLYLLNPAPLLVVMEYPMYFLRSLLTLFVILYVTFLILASSNIASHLSSSKLLSHLSPLFSKMKLHLTQLITELCMLLVLAVV